MSAPRSVTLTHVEQCVRLLTGGVTVEDGDEYLVIVGPTIRHVIRGELARLRWKLQYRDERLARRAAIYGKRFP